MNKPQHTPSPWQAIYDDGWYISAAPGTAATTSHPTDSLVILDLSRDDETAAADAFLIAAAPELLSTLHSVADWFEEVAAANGGDFHQGLTGLIDATLAKAERD